MVGTYWRIILFLLAVPGGPALAANINPPPVFHAASVDVAVARDAVRGLYRYDYVIGNPVDNSGVVWKFRVDVAAEAAGQMLWDDGLTVPMADQPVPFSTVRNLLAALPSLNQRRAIPFGQEASLGWNGGLEADGHAVFSSGDLTPGVAPGMSQGGFALVSPGFPRIRMAQVTALWMHITEDHDLDEPEDLAASGAIEQSLRVSVNALGPSALTPGSFEHWNQFEADVAEAGALGWIVDSALLAQVKSLISSARTYLDTQDPAGARTALGSLIALVRSSSASSMNQAAYSLITVNAQLLIEQTPDFPIPYEPTVSLTPELAKLSIGQTVTLQATLINAADKKPISNAALDLCVEEGVHLYGESQQTDDQGKATFSFTGQGVGIDKLVVRLGGVEATVEDRSSVVWSGGPDLVVPLFIPPVLQTKGGRTFYVTETTENIGNTEAGASTTTYYLTANPDYVTDRRVVGWRSIAGLAPREASSVTTTPLQMPGDLPIGTYYLSACADAESVVFELEEDNNCSFAIIEGSDSKVVPVETPVNLPPDCGAATPTVPVLWPPNHRLVEVGILGIQDPDGDPVAIQVTGVTQDEPVNGLGDGDASPDAVGVGSANVSVRAERSGLGNGRVYQIHFLGDDGKGGSCVGAVAVGVPHDQRRGSIPVDDGQLFDSAVP